MCAQCYAAAATAVGAAAGTRVWIFSWLGARLTPRRGRTLSAVIVVLAILGAGVGLGGAG